MKRFRPFFVLALLACWLPATTHCAMEAADVVTATCCEADKAATADHADEGQHCSEWENKITSSSETGALVKAPPLACLCLLCALLLDEAPPVVSERPPEEFPPTWRTTWHFERRSALPVRAPALA